MRNTLNYRRYKINLVSYKNGVLALIERPDKAGQITVPLSSQVDAMKFVIELIDGICG